MCYSRVGLKTRKSFKEIVMHHIRSENDKLVRPWNASGALVKPTWMTYITLVVFKGCFMLIAFTYANLVVIMAQVDGVKGSSLSQVIKQVCNLWNWKHIELCLKM